MSCGILTLASHKPYEATREYLAWLKSREESWFESAFNLSDPALDADRHWSRRQAMHSMRVLVELHHARLMVEAEILAERLG